MAPPSDHDHRLVKRDAYEFGKKARNGWEWLWDKMEKFVEGWKDAAPNTSASVSVVKREAKLTGKDLQEMVNWQKYAAEHPGYRGPFFDPKPTPLVGNHGFNGQLVTFNVPGLN